MRIQRAHIESFGPFVGLDHDGLSPGLNVVLGPDMETLTAFRDFIRATLFGFPSDPKRGPVSPTAPCGGLLELVCPDGTPLTIERYLRGSGVGAGQVSISRGGDMRPPDDAIALAISMGERAYSDRFELIRAHIDTKDGGGDELLARVIAISAGAEASDPLALIRWLDEETESLRRELTAAETARRVAAERQSSAQGDFDDYATLDAQYADIGRQVASNDDELTTARARLYKVRALEDSRPLWDRMRELQSAMVGMPRFAFLPDDAVGVLDRLDLRVHEIQSERQEHESEAAGRTREIEELKSELHEQFPLDECRRLVVRQDEYAEAVREAPAVTARLEEVEKLLESGLAGLGDGWDEARLDAVDDSAGTRDRLERLDTGLRSAESEMAGLSQRANELGERMEAKRDAVRDAETRLKSLGDPPGAAPEIASGDGPEITEFTGEDGDRRFELIARARGEMAELSDARRHVEEALLRSVVARPKRAITAGRLIPLAQLGLSAGFAVVGLLTWILAAAAGDTSVVRTGQIVAGTGIVGALMSIAVLMAQGRHSRAQYRASAVLHDLAARAAEELEQAIETARVQLAYSEEQVRGTLQELGLPRDLPLAGLDEERERTARRIDQWHTREEAESALSRARSEFDSAAWDSEGASEALDDARNRLDALRDDWSDFVSYLELPPDLTAAAVSHSLDTMAELRRLRAEARVLRLRAPALRISIVEIEAGLSEIGDLANLPEFPAGKAGPVLADLAEKMDTIRRRRDRAGALRRENEAGEDRLRSLDKEAEAVVSDRKKLFELAGVDDGERFREIAEQEAERRRLSRELEEVRRAAPHLTGPAGREMEEELRDAAPEALAAERDGLVARIERLEELHRRLQIRLDDIAERREELAGPPRALDHGIELGRIAADAGRLARRRVLIEVARRILAGAFESYRAGGQGERLRIAGEYLARLSGGELVEVRSAAGKPDDIIGMIEVAAANGHAERADALAPGALRLLYMAMRFAVAHEHAERGQALPVVIDDLAAGLDPAMARPVAAALDELARHVQVILLATHPQTLDRAREAAVDGAPHLVDLGFGGRQMLLSA